MNGVLLHSESEQDLKLILQLARKLGISAKKLSREEIEDYGLSRAISQGKSGEYVDTDTFLKELGDDSMD